MSALTKQELENMAGAVVELFEQHRAMVFKSAAELVSAPLQNAPAVELRAPVGCSLCDAGAVPDFANYVTADTAEQIKQLVEAAVAFAEQAARIDHESLFGLIDRCNTPPAVEDEWQSFKELGRFVFDNKPEKVKTYDFYIDKDGEIHRDDENIKKGQLEYERKNK